MFDNEMMVRSGTTHLTADESGSYVAYPKSKFPLELCVIVPTIGQATDTIDITITLSEDGTNAAEVITMPQITGTNVLTNKITAFYCALPQTRPYFKVDFNITDASGSDFDAGHVHAGLVPAGRHATFNGY
jgi:hypothetical protein